MTKPFSNPLPTEKEINESFEMHTDALHRWINSSEILASQLDRPAPGGLSFNINFLKEYRTLHMILCYLEWLEAQLTEQGEHHLSVLTRLSPQDLVLIQEYIGAIRPIVDHLSVLINTVENARYMEKVEGAPSLISAINNLATKGHDAQAFAEKESQANELLTTYADEAAKPFRYSAYVWGKPYDFVRKTRDGVGGNLWTMRQLYGRQD